MDIRISTDTLLYMNTELEHGTVYKFKSGTEILVYHGTSQDSANDITRNGIQETLCKSANMGKGFYVSIDQKYAKTHGEAVV